MHVHGGAWTDDKLQVMQRYFSAYAQALKNQRFERWYIDAFAGTGERADSRKAAKATSKGSAPLFGDESDEIAAAKKGSARIALGIDPPFDRYVFVDKSTDHVVALRALKGEFPDREIDVRSADANLALRDLAKDTNWRTTRAAIFIDPYGMQIDWETLRILSDTKAVDIALLFPTGPLNRMLARRGDIPTEWASRIDSHLGPCDWRNASYKQTMTSDLFSSEIPAFEKAINTEGLRQFVYRRLSSIFAYVCEEQLEMKNSRGVVLYHLFIICANDREPAKALAKRLALGAMKLPKRAARR
jgi:three-Cys-motif partner protein